MIEDTILNFGNCVPEESKRRRLFFIELRRWGHHRRRGRNLDRRLRLKLNRSRRFRLCARIWRGWRRHKHRVGPDLSDPRRRRRWFTIDRHFIRQLKSKLIIKCKTKTPWPLFLFHTNSRSERRVVCVDWKKVLFFKEVKVCVWTQLQVQRRSVERIIIYMTK